MSKLSNMSGFPEWLPEEKLIEDQIIATVKAIYESHGFTPIETPAVEHLTTLLSKGLVEKELYAVHRLNAEAGEPPEFGLHYDLTVPFARYVAQHFNELTFPFKRYQLQKSWRGERPQKGRFREFYQFDIDVIARDVLPISCDAEIVTVLDKAFSAAKAVRHKVHLNHRKLLRGLYASFGLTEAQQKAAIAEVDKLNKVSRDGVFKELTEHGGIDAPVALKILECATLKFSPSEAAAGLRSMGVSQDLFHEGCEELLKILDLVPGTQRPNLVVDLSLARGLDYYTGIIIEVLLPEYPEFGAAGAGGRYEDLASAFIKQKLPGVGASFGLTRYMALVLGEKVLTGNRRAPTEVVIAVYDEEQRVQCNDMAEEFRAHGIATEVFPTAPKLGKQIEYADKKGIPYVAFLEPGKSGVEIKDIRTGEQNAVPDIAAWCQAHVAS